MWHVTKWSKFLLLIVITLRFGNAQSTPLASVPPYPDTTAGLERLINDVLLLQRNGDTAALSPYLQSLVLPDSERWFVSKFGDTRCGEPQLGPNDCLGPRMALTYQSLAGVLPASFSLTLNDLQHEGLTNFEATNYTDDCPGPQRIVAARELVGGLTTTPYVSTMLSGLVQHREPIYVLWVYNESKETTMPFFVYFDRAFRYVGMLHPASVEDFQKAKATGKNPGLDPLPHHLTEDQLEMKKVQIDPSQVQRTVVLRVSVNTEGKPKDVAYVRGPEAEKEVAIQSVMKRHFDRPGFGPGGFHSGRFCLNVMPTH